jgi:hypothetical protein
MSISTMSLSDPAALKILVQARVEQLRGGTLRPAGGPLRPAGARRLRRTYR